MLVRKLALKNIRSYNDGEEATLEVPDGVVLFEGDIGSGKSTLLYAIEFALFGFSDLKGSHLLSEGKQSGRVSVTIASGGTEYTIERHLKVRGQEVVQDECYISSKGERTRLSAGDLKERVVSILGFNEPTHPKAESLVYRYAVFTPQEQMKEILVQNPEDRMHVIRRILGAQSYQVAAENSETVERSIREISQGLRRASAELQDRKDDLAGSTRSTSDTESTIPLLKQASADASKLVFQLESQWKEFVGQHEALTKVEALVPKLKEEVADLKEDVASQDEALRDLERRLAHDLEPFVKEFESIPKPSSSSKELQRLLDSAREDHQALADSRAVLEADLAKSKDLVSKGICPVCGQKVPGDMATRTEHTEMELSQVKEKLEVSSKLVTDLSAKLDHARDYESKEPEQLRSLKEIERVDGEIKAARRKLQSSNEKLARRRVELDEASARVREMRDVSEKVADLERRLKEARDKDKKAALALGQAESDLSSLRKEVDRLSSEVKKMQEAQDESLRLGKYQTWLSTFFRPSVRLIESQTLNQAASRFNEHFQRFFTSLVDDPDMLVRVKEDFTPVFEREGFEQDFEALSGGERTSMALAYRFALNAVVRESILSQPELVILDEPTDGFSKEQVFKMRGLLEQLDSRQVILVSHERELESMADHVFRVTKRNGTSEVLSVPPS